MSAIKFITENDLEQAAGEVELKARLTGDVEGLDKAPHDHWVIFIDALKQRARPVPWKQLEFGEEGWLLVGNRQWEGFLELLDSPEEAELLVNALAAAKDERSRFEGLIRALVPENLVPSEAVVAQARANALARSAFLSEFPSLSSAQVADVYGSQATNRAALAQSWRKYGKLFAIETPAGLRYPLFQFDDHGRPRTVIERVLRPLHEAGVDGWQAALWFTGALASLDDQRPIDLLDSDPERVVEAATRVADVPY